VQGRPNKPADSCYSFWIGGVLQVLGAADLINPEYLMAFNLSCEHAAKGTLLLLSSLNRLSAV
jgi:geranylgeranyl transferase type-1 subunit beta